MNLTEPGYDFIGKSEAPLLRTLASTTSSMSGNQLVRVAGLKYNGGHVLTLRKLVKLGIITTDPRLAANYYSINREHILWSAIETILFAKENALKTIKENLEVVPILASAASVALFGSVARGDSTADSDIDVFALLPKNNTISDEEYAALQTAVDRIHALTGNIVNIMDVNEAGLADMVASGDPMVANLYADSITLFGAELKGMLGK
jgi:predicted nucleotidyltransferase